MEENTKPKLTMDEALMEYENRSVLNLYTDKIEMARQRLNFEQLGILLCLIIDHSQLKDTTELENKADEKTCVYFDVIRQSIDYDRQIWVRNCMNGSKGGRPKKNNMLAKKIEKRVKEIQNNPNETTINPNETENKAKDKNTVMSMANDKDINTDMGISTDRGISTNTGISTLKDRDTQKGIADEELSDNLPPVPREIEDHVWDELERIHEIRDDFIPMKEAERILNSRKKDPNYDIDDDLWHLENYGAGY